MGVVNVHKMKEFKDGIRVSKMVIDNEDALIHIHYYSTGSRVQPHSHADCVDIYYVIQGKGHALIGNKKKILRRGDIMAIPRDTIHGVVNPYKAPLIMLDILAPKPKGASSQRPIATAVQSERRG